MALYPHARIDSATATNPDAQLVISDDKHSLSVLYPDGRSSTPNVRVWVRVPAEDWPFTDPSGVVQFNGIKASSLVHPDDEVDPSYQVSGSTSPQYRWQATENLDWRLKQPYFFGAKSSVNSFVIDGTGKEKWKANELDEGKDIEWTTELHQRLKETYALTRGSFPTLTDFSENNGVWTATVFNSASYP